MAHPDDDDDDDRAERLASQLWAVSLWVAAIALFGTKYYKLCGFCVVLGGLFWFMSLQELGKEEKLSIQFNVYSPHDCYQYLQDTDRVDMERYRMVCHVALHSLARKLQRASNNISGDSKETDDPELDQISLYAQRTVYNHIFLYATDRDDLIDPALAILALCASIATARNRHATAQFPVSKLLDMLRQSLKRAKTYDAPPLERRAAELQRKGCLLLGSLANQDDTLGPLLVRAGALSLVLDSLQWYRCHAQVANWGLWCLFVLCSNEANDPTDNDDTITTSLLKTVLMVLPEHAQEKEVVQHGVAVLFALLSQTSKSSSKTKHSLFRRQVAVHHNLHGVLNDILSHPQASHTVQMGHELLIGTGGALPEANK